MHIHQWYFPIFYIGRGRTGKTEAKHLPPNIPYYFGLVQNMNRSINTYLHIHRQTCMHVYRHIYIYMPHRGSLGSLGAEGPWRPRVPWGRGSLGAEGPLGPRVPWGRGSLGAAPEAVSRAVAEALGFILLESNTDKFIDLYLHVCMCIYALTNSFIHYLINSLTH